MRTADDCRLADFPERRTRAWWVWGCSLGAGVMAGFWLDDDLWRLLAALVALALLAVPRLPTNLAVGRPRLRNHLLLLLAVACAAQATAPDLWRFGTSSWVRVWNVYHYYLGSKYFPELGYHDLYVATLAADEAGDDYWASIRTVRDLSTYELVSRSAAVAVYDPTLHFSDDRWRAFQRDVRALQGQREPERWRNIFRDRGYNPTPLWTALGRLLTRAPADWLWALKLLCALDLLLLGVTFYQVDRVFGRRALAAALLFFTLSPVNEGRIVGGLLQYDWFCALALGLCSLRQRRAGSAAVAFAYAAGTRVFPAVLLVSLGVPWIRRYVLHGRWPRSDRRLTAALALSAVTAFGLATLAGGGLGAWRSFASNIEQHSRAHRLGQQRLGWAHAFTRDIRTLDFSRPDLDDRRALFEQQKPLFVVSGMLLLGLWGVAVWRRNPGDAFLLGLVPFFALTVSSRYYWACLALLPLLARPGPAGRRRGRILLSSQAGLLVILALAGLRGLEGFSFYSFFDLLLALFWVVVLAVYLVGDLRVWRRRRPLAEVHHSRALVVAFLVGLLLLLCWLRLPDPEAPIRDVDEAVSALIAEAWLDGGVPYRDAIDQRGPVTYLVYAVVFALFGVHNMVAVHWALLLLILVSCGLVFQLGRSLRPGARGAAVAYLAALLVAVGSFTYRRSQMLAFHTEWPMLFFDALAMLLLWSVLRGEEIQSTGKARSTGWRLVAAGACFALGFLSKQPGIFDAGSAAVFILLWRQAHGVLFHRGTVATAVRLAGGFFATLGLTAIYFAAHGALGDFVLYYWTYNVEHYTAVIPLADRLAALDPFAHGRHYLTANPLLLVGSSIAVVQASVAWIRSRQVDGRLMVVLWFLAAYFGASFSGRNFGHYFIQILVPASLATALAVSDLWCWLAPRGPGFRHVGDLSVVARGALVVGLAVSLVAPVVRFGDEIGWRQVWKKRRVDDARERLLAAIRRHTSPEDPVFVWGYYPELYVLAPRRPASRYSNTNYLTGMLPWENHQPGIDTSEHIVEGAWDLLMTELEANRPKLVVDTAVGDHRHYSKYPVKDFPRLAELLARDYVRQTVVRDRRDRPVAALWLRRGEH